MCCIFLCVEGTVHVFACLASRSFGLYFSKAGTHLLSHTAACWALLCIYYFNFKISKSECRVGVGVLLRHNAITHTGSLIFFKGGCWWVQAVDKYMRDSPCRNSILSVDASNNEIKRKKQRERKVHLDKPFPPAFLSYFLSL